MPKRAVIEGSPRAMLFLLMSLSSSLVVAQTCEAGTPNNLIVIDKFRSPISGNSAGQSNSRCFER
jgi:hypothetical protein